MRALPRPPIYAESTGAAAPTTIARRHTGLTWFTVAFPFSRETAAGLLHTFWSRPEAGCCRSGLIPGPLPDVPRLARSRGRGF